jgi:hypothetical protein
MLLFRVALLLGLVSLAGAGDPSHAPLGTWLGSINAALMGYAKPLEGLGYTTNGLAAADEIEILKLFDQVKVKKPHRKVFLKGWKALKSEVGTKPTNAKVDSVTKQCAEDDEDDHGAHKAMMEEVRKFVGPNPVSKHVQELAERKRCKVVTNLLAGDLEFEPSHFYQNYYEKKWKFMPGGESPGKRKDLGVDELGSKDIFASLLRNQNNHQDRRSPITYGEIFAFNRMADNGDPQESETYQPYDYIDYGKNGEEDFRRLALNAKEVKICCDLAIICFNAPPPPSSSSSSAHPFATTVYHPVSLFPPTFYVSATLSVMQHSV